MSKFIAMLEDDSDDRYLTSDTLSELKIDVPVKYFSSSTELIRSLQTDARPALILLF